MIAKIIFILIAAGSLILGLFIFARPLWVIEFQKRFYRLINWNIEPVSMEREIRNTRVMGLFLMIFVLGVAVYGLVKIF